MEPDTLQLGDSAVITVKVSDRHGVVDRVEGYVVEDPRLKFNFKDDGVAPDEKAGDGVWTFQGRCAVPGSLRRIFVGGDRLPCRWIAGAGA